MQRVLHSNNCYKSIKLIISNSKLIKKAQLYYLKVDIKITFFNSFVSYKFQLY